MSSSSTSEALLNPLGDKASRMRKLLASGKAIAVPGAFNAMVAKLAEAAGFEMVYVSGAGLSNGVGGYPDIGMLGMEEMVRESGYIARATNLPTIADADTGFGEAVNVFRVVQEYERAGLCGIHIEDQLFPKRCGHLGGKQVITVENMCEKVQAAVKARQNKDFLIIARVDSRAVHGYDDAVNRAIAYLQAGADMIFPEAMETPDEFATFTRRVREACPAALFLANMTEFGKSPYISLEDFERFGYNLVIYPMTAFRVMMKAVGEAFAELKAEGTQSGFLDRMATRRELYDLLHYDAYESLDAMLSRQDPAAADGSPVS